MLTCKACGRKFRNMQALGGHTAHGHAQGRKGTSASTTPGAPVQAEAAGDSQSTQPAPGAEPVDEASEADQIRSYLQKGYTLEQLLGFGFKRATVRQEMEKLIAPANPSKDGAEAEADGMLPVTVKGSEVITPESIIQRIVADGSREWQLRIEGMMLLRAAQKMVREDVEIMRMQAEADAKLLEPILRVMQEARAEQDSAAQRARASVAEAAQQAAGEATGQVAEYFDGKLAALEQKVAKKEAAHPMKETMATMDRAMSGTIGTILKGLGFSDPAGPQEAPPGFTYKQKGGQA